MPADELTKRKLAEQEQRNDEELRKRTTAIRHDLNFRRAQGKVTPENVRDDMDSVSKLMASKSEKTISQTLKKMRNDKDNISDEEIDIRSKQKGKSFAEGVLNRVTQEGTLTGRIWRLGGSIGGFFARKKSEEVRNIKNTLSGRTEYLMKNNLVGVSPKKGEFLLRVKQHPGASKGQKYHVEKLANKYIYKRDSTGRIISKRLNYRSPNYEFYRQELRANRMRIYKGRLQYKKNSKQWKAFAKKMTQQLEPQQSESAFENQRMSFYREQMLRQEQAGLIDNPFTEAAVRENRNLEAFQQRLNASRSSWEIAQQQMPSKLAKMKKIIETQRENMRQANILNAPKFVKQGNIDLFESIFSKDNPNSINILAQREDSLNLMKTNRPSILNANNIFKHNPEDENNILRAKKLFFGT